MSNASRKFSSMVLRIDVHDNRIEILDGLWPLRKRQVIPFRNIATVGVGQWTKRLEITTNDGKTLRYAFDNTAKTRRCHDEIIARM